MQMNNKSTLIQSFKGAAKKNSDADGKSTVGGGGGEGGRSEGGGLGIQRGKAPRASSIFFFFSDQWTKFEEVNVCFFFLDGLI